MATLTQMMFANADNSLIILKNKQNLSTDIVKVHPNRFDLADRRVVMFKVIHSVQTTNHSIANEIIQFFPDINYYSIDSSGSYTLDFSDLQIPVLKYEKKEVKRILSLQTIASSKMSERINVEFQVKLPVLNYLMMNIGFAHGFFSDKEIEKYKLDRLENLKNFHITSYRLGLGLYYKFLQNEICLYYCYSSSSIGNNWVYPGSNWSYFKKWYNSEMITLSQKYYFNDYFFINMGMRYFISDIEYKSDTNLGFQLGFGFELLTNK